MKATKVIRVVMKILEISEMKPQMHTDTHG
ncbi:MAG: hypothetical protein QOH63_1150 [Acidobacteriota bacterium]|jgi:hypothetical protein|nr:hypothetical protein [Acidobacteriota bacterium]